MVLRRFIAGNAASYEAAKTRLRDAVPLGRHTKRAISKGLSRAHQLLAQDFAFIHINKCGGTSLERALGIPFLNHDTALERQAWLGARRWDDRFTFTLVRNPYDRFVSRYFYQETDLDYEALLADFPRALDDLEARTEAGTLTRYQGPMTHWVCDAAGRLLVDHVYRLEELDACATDLGDRLGRKIEIQRVKLNPHSYDKNVILGDAGYRRRIAAFLQSDFELFGYDP